MSDVIFNWVPDRGSPLPLYRQLAIISVERSLAATGLWATGSPHSASWPSGSA